MYNKKSLLIFSLFFIVISVKTFYEGVKIEFEYNFDCDENCGENHEIINFTYNKVSKIWFVLDCFQSVQVGIPENDEIYFEIISDLIRVINELENIDLIFKSHKKDIKILRETLTHLINHAAVEKNEILSIVIGLLEKKLIQYENS